MFATARPVDVMISVDVAGREGNLDRHEELRSDMEESIEASASRDNIRSLSAEHTQPPARPLRGELTGLDITWLPGRTCSLYPRNAGLGTAIRFTPQGRRPRRSLAKRPGLLRVGERTGLQQRACCRVFGVRQQKEVRRRRHDPPPMIVPIVVPLGRTCPERALLRPATVNTAKQSRAGSSRRVRRAQRGQHIASAGAR
ncbi:hypothetical protein CC78DRAFT_578985 [Lojkania enalia]|uniref:Uncharacterized protein n=1 Tax=Lojkania enalia TaxID=147567 RepID=A0A9P4N4J5_9PLEO|nr:hypothetical protein CC78DRAFT_578985 [Didymosphaeria enalia]